jgi:hypothetical protein
MTPTNKQHELVDELLAIIRATFPETTVLSLHNSPESDNDLWVNIGVPDDDTFIAIGSLVSMRENEMLLETGYKITVMPRVMDMDVEIEPA